MNHDVSRSESLSITCYVVGSIVAVCACLPLKLFVTGILLMFAPDMVQRETKGDMDQAVGFFFAIVGRGLRRMNYDPDPETGLLSEEYVDVYGIPFSVIPFKGRPVDKPAPEDKPKNRVWALPDREDMEIRFPVVEGYVFQTTKGLLKCDVDQIEPLFIDPKTEPTATYLRPTAGYLDTQSGSVPFAFEKQSRDAYYAQMHIQSILFQITQQVIDDLLAPSKVHTDKKSRVSRFQSRHQLFPQVFSFVKAYVQRVNFNGVDQRELGLERYMRLTVERVRDAIRPDDSLGEPPLLPILNRYRPYQSTGGVDFVTTRPVVPAQRSHINSVVLHSNWEATAAQLMDSRSDLAKFYARNDHLGLVIPYEYEGVDHGYTPDFIVELANGVKLVLEIKGYEVHGKQQTDSKHNAARKWVTAVNNLGDFGKWDFLVCRDLKKLLHCLTELANGRPVEMVLDEDDGELLLK